MDLATNYMVNEVRKGNTASSVSLAEWVTNNEAYMRAPTDSRGIKHALNDVNDLVKQKTEAAEELFDTLPRNGVIRNY
jgi:hypothetical protein